MFILKLLRKKIVLALIFSLSFSYCLISLLNGSGSHSSNGLEGNLHDYETDVDIDKLNIIPRRPIFNDNFSDDMIKVNQGGAAANQPEIQCRNSVQGKVLIADDRGAICLRKDVQLNGCCDDKSPTTKQYSCETCQDQSGCCAIYEYCISCCMQPSKKPLLNNIVGGSSKTSETFNVLFASITDHFELCLTKCRTSSASVQHENSYRDPKAKHCYGDNISQQHNSKS